MEYTKYNDYIKIDNPTDFNIKHICECGQMFRFEDKNTHFVVRSSNNEAVVYQNNDKSVVIESKNLNYYENYFDLQTDYGIIKKELIKTPILETAIQFGYGIRICRQEILETIISFIISANNNIGRIKKIINQLCENFGQNMGNYFAFPTLDTLKNVSENDFQSMGAGYRAKYLVDTISKIDENFLQKLKSMDTSDAYNLLIGLKGVGNKVCECILLFGLSRLDVFPVDVWMDRVCKDYFFLNAPRQNKSKEMVKLFGNLAGYAQQYLFYYKRELKEN